MEIKVRGISTVATGVNGRVSYLEERVSELERKRLP